MNAVIGVSEMLLEDARDLGRDDEIEPLERILRAGQHLVTLINDILDLAKIEAGKMELRPQAFPLGPLVADVVTIIRPLAEPLQELSDRWSGRPPQERERAAVRTSPASPPA
jgi:signal transduction histidine kinase